MSSGTDWLDALDVDPRAVDKELTRRGLALPVTRVNLWDGTPYADLTGACAFAFLTQCVWTDNDADQAVELIPPRLYIRELAEEWVACFSLRMPLVLEKSRRMIASWVFRGLELWAAGLARGNWLVCDQDYPHAAMHVWRHTFIYATLRQRRPGLGLPPAAARGGVVARECDMFILGNGSTISNANEQAGALQGEGKTAIVLEEFSRYRDPGGMWAQARFLTQGSPSKRGGWVAGICNASANEDYRKLKDWVARTGPDRCSVLRPLGEYQ